MSGTGTFETPESDPRQVSRRAANALETTLLHAGEALAAAVEHADELFGQERGPYIRSTWPAAQRDLEHLIEYVRVTSDSQFDRVGLGPEAASGKLEGVARWARIFKREADTDDRRPRLARKLFVRFASYFNSALGSILSEIPLAGEILREFKEHLENAAQDKVTEDEDADVRAAVERDSALQGDDGF